MIEAQLIRFHYPEFTLGVFFVGETVFRTIERPWADNKTNISCIPAGTYICRWLPRSSSGKYRNVWWLQDVPGRSGVLIHSGNYYWHSTGCIILGKRHGRLGKDTAVLSSHAAMRELREIVGEEDFRLTITGDY